MFIIDPDPRFTHPVKVRVPVDGGFKTQECKATFKVLDSEIVNGFDLNEVKGSIEFLRAVLVRLDDLGTAEKEPVEYNDAVRDQVLKLPYFRAAAARTYFEGIAGARSGN